MLPNSQIGYQKLSLRNHTLKEEPKKGTIHQRIERHYITDIFLVFKFILLVFSKNYDILQIFQK